MSASDYESRLAEWKARNGVTTPGMDEPDPEELMVAEDAKRPGKDYCLGCAERFKISEMRLVTRSQDPYVQDEDEGEPTAGNEWWIPVKSRVRMCKPCFKEQYDQEGEAS